MNYLILTDKGSPLEDLQQDLKEIKDIKKMGLPREEQILVCELKNAHAVFFDSLYGLELTTYLIEKRNKFCPQTPIILVGISYNDHFDDILQNSSNLVFWDLSQPLPIIKSIFAKLFNKELEQRFSHLQERLLDAMKGMLDFKESLTIEYENLKNTYRNKFPRRQSIWGPVIIASQVDVSENVGGEFHDALFFKERLSGVLWHVPSFSISDLLLERWTRFKEQEMFDLSLAKIWLREVKDNTSDLNLPLKSSWIHWLFYHFDKSTLTLQGYSGGEHIIKIISGDSVETLTSSKVLPLSDMDDVSEAYFVKSLQTGDRIVILSSGLIMRNSEFDWDQLLLETSFFDIRDFIDEVFIRISSEEPISHDSTLIVMDIKEQV